MLTGRAYGFIDDARMGEISGFTNPEESEHDWFRCGHTSTSISLACGFAKARDILGQDHNVVAFIGDGCLSGGEAFEGLDNAATFSSNRIIVVNDNEMSIAEDHGGIYGDFAELRASGGTAARNFFSTFGFDYRYVEEGNSIPALIAAFEEVKDIDHPVVVHIHTTKGKGDEWAEQNKEAAHSVKADGGSTPAESYTGIIRARMLEKMAADPEIVVINAGTPGGSGITAEFRAIAGDRYVDVGICEQHAVTFSAALARGGVKPVYFVASTFLQRAYDQIVQDLALNQSPATVLVFQAGFSSIDATHLGVFDLAYTGNVPGLTCLAPTTAEQLLAMLDWSLDSPALRPRPPNSSSPCSTGRSMSPTSPWSSAFPTGSSMGKRLLSPQPTSLSSPSSTRGQTSPSWRSGQRSSLRAPLRTSFPPATASTPPSSPPRPTRRSTVRCCSRSRSAIASS